MIILAIDQSYTHTGFCVADGSEVLAYPIFNYPKHMYDEGLNGGMQKRKICKRDKRLLIVAIVKQLIERYEVQAIIVERVRTHAQGKMSPATTKALHAMVCAIVDAVEVPVFCVDTRAWKSKVLGNPSATKQDAIDFCTALLQPDNPLDDDTADAICMALAVSRGIKLDDVE